MPTGVLVGGVGRMTTGVWVGVASGAPSCTWRLGYIRKKPANPSTQKQQIPTKIKMARMASKVFVELFTNYTP